MYNTDWLRHNSDTAYGFWFPLTPFDLETVFRKQLAPLFQLLFPDESLLGTSIPQDFSRVESDECPGGPKREESPFRGPSYSDEPFFELSLGLPARRSYFSSLRCPRFPSGHSRAQRPSLRHLAHLVRSFSC